MTDELEKGFYCLKLDPQMRWYQRPNVKCSGAFYEEKVNLLVNWFKFASKITERPYHEYKVEMFKVKQFKNKRSGKTESKRTPIPLLSRNELFWKFLRFEKSRSQYFDVDKHVFDGKETVYSVIKYDNLVEVEMPGESLAVTYELRMCLMTTFRLNFSQKEPSEAEQVNKSYKFLKDVVTQKVRYSPEENERIAIEFTRNFVYDSNVIHRVPESFYDPDRFEHHLAIAPRIEAWFGIYIGVKELFDGEPVLNFGIVHKLFYNAPSMSLLDYLLLIVDPETSNDEWRKKRKTEIREQSFGIRKSAYGRVNQLLSGVKLKCTQVWDEKRLRMVERHLNFLKLDDLNSKEHQISYSEGRGRDAKRRRAPLYQVYENNRMYIEFLDLPLVLVKSGTNEYKVPMEHLQVYEKPQRFKNMIDMCMKDKFIKAATRKPHVYKQETLQMLKDLELDATHGLDFVKSFELSSDLKMIQCPGKVLREPELVDRTNKRIQMTPIVRGFREQQLNVVPEKELCCALFILRHVDEQKPCLSEEQAFKLYTDLMHGCEFRSLRIGRNDENPAARSLLQWKDNDGKTKFGFFGSCPLVETGSNFHAAVELAKRKFDALPDRDQKALLFIVVAKPNLNAYGLVKWLCDIKHGVASQYINVETVNRILAGIAQEKPSHRIAYQLALKINAKLGGVNQELDYSESGEMSAAESEERRRAPLKMFVGIDVTHPTNNSGLDFSIASIVASINAGGTRYRNVVITQQECRPGERPVAHGRERTDILEGKFKILLRKFAENNENRVPDHIVIYRDGVSDSEMLRVSHDELRSLKREVDQFLRERSSNEPVHPKYTYLVVQKRHQTRFFRQIGERPDESKCVDEKSRSALKRYDEESKESAGTGLVNVSSGTVVDKVVVSAYKFDYFLSSHHGAIGTSRPCHYTVMHDDSRMTQDEVYKMSYELAFLSARCRKPISLPAPVHYAHLSCEKAKEIYRAARRQQIPGVNIGSGMLLEDREKIERFLTTHELYPGMSFA